MSLNSNEHLEVQEPIDTGNDLQKALAEYKDYDGCEAFIKLLERRDDKDVILNILTPSNSPLINETRRI